MTRRPVLIAGPTASGKSELAIRIAQRDRGCVVNADALQVYSCWSALSARPSEDDLSRAPHALYGHVDAAIRYSVGDWLRDLAPVLNDLARKGIRPIVVGGTGLYLSSLFSGLANIPPIAPEVRAASQKMVDHCETFRMLEDLRLRDPVTHARIDRQNSVRIQRAWEVLASTGRTLSSWQAESAAPILAPENCDCYVLAPPLALQHAAVEARFERMLTSGAIEECREYLARSLPPGLPSARALGAEQIFAHLRGDMTLQCAAAAAVVATRQFSKRQRTWFRNRMKDWHSIDPTSGDPLAAIAADPD